MNGQAKGTTTFVLECIMLKSCAWVNC